VAIIYNQRLLDEKIITWMRKYYVGFFDTSENFRGHEFEKHGSCWNPPKPDDLKDWHNKYFNTIKGLNDRFNLLTILTKAGIVPSNKKTYTAN